RPPTAPQQTARPPPAGPPSYVSPASWVGVAVVDSGVAEHADLNVVEHVHIVPPATYNAQARADGTLASMYIFDERNGTKAYDRVSTHPNGAALHLSVEDASKVA